MIFHILFNNKKMKLIGLVENILFIYLKSDKIVLMQQFQFQMSKNNPLLVPLLWSYPKLLFHHSHFLLFLLFILISLFLLSLFINFLANLLTFSVLSSKIENNNLLLDVTVLNHSSHIFISQVNILNFMFNVCMPFHC